jgi:hypothetical protein
MAFDKIKLCELIAAQPKIRSVDLAELMDCEPAQIVLALQPYVDRGEIFMRLVTAPNGATVTEYECSAGLKAHLLLTKATMATMATVVIESVPESSTLKFVPAERPAKPAPVPKAELTHADRVIDYIRANGGRTTSLQLCEFLGLKPRHYPSNYLRGAVHAGRLIKKGNYWTLGANEIRDVQVSPAPLPAPMPEPTNESEPELACALWSNGDLQVNRNGAILAIFRDAEVQQIAAFLGRIAA